MKKLKTFAHNLDKLRKEQRKSLTEFAQEIGIPKSTMQSVMKDGNTTLDTAVRIASALDIPLDSLLSDSLTEAAFIDYDADSESAKDAAARHINAAKEMLSVFDGLDRQQQIAVEYFVVRIMETVEKKK